MTDILFIDNFDSFTYNLVDEFSRLGLSVAVYRNSMKLEAMGNIIRDLSPRLLVIGPGPSTPSDAGICIDLIRNFHTELPMLGVCLGHQCLVEAFGGKVGICPQIFHGKPSMISHNGQGAFLGLPQPLQVGRYHSLHAETLPEAFEVSAETDGIIMAIQHRDLPLFGLQFHPESILTPYGRNLIKNILETTSHD